MIVSRAAAKSEGLLRYFTGSPCKHGHVAERLTINGSCCTCAKERATARYRADPASDLARQKEYRLAHPELQERKLAKRYAADPALVSRVELRKKDADARAAAVAAGITTYESPRQCGKCETLTRFSADGKCVECSRRACLKRYHKTEAVTPRRPKPEPCAPGEKKLRPTRAKQDTAYAIVKAARGEAMRLGLLKYIGRPCPKGHSGERYTKHGCCVECSAAMASSAEKKAYDAEYLKANREAILERTRQYNANLSAEEKARRNEQAREWARRNPEKRRAICDNNKHMRRAQMESGLTWREFAAWKKATQKVCFWCGVDCADNFHVDHFFPLSRGGKHEIENLVIACQPCNNRKSSKMPEQFMEEVLSGRVSHIKNGVTA